MKMDDTAIPPMVRFLPLFSLSFVSSDEQLISYLESLYDFSMNIEKVRKDAIAIKQPKLT
jgi:hypothetical protein